MPLLKDLNLSCSRDWDYFAFLYEMPSISLFEYSQFPLWNPYCGGGIPLIGNPQAGFPSPIFLITSIFGVIAGLKIAVWLHTFAGLWGMWLLAGEMGIRGQCRLVPPVIFMFSGPWVFHLTEGHITWLPAAFLPFIMLAFLKGMENSRWLIAAAIFESIMIYEGGTYVLAYSVLFLMVLALCKSLESRDLKPLQAIMVVNLLAAALSAPKLLPMLDLLASNPRVMDLGKVRSWDEFLGSFIDRDTYLGAINHEFSAYVGITVVVLYLFSITILRKQKALIISSVLIMLVSIGNFAPLSPWTLLHKLPLYRNFQFPTRSLIVLFFTVALLVGLYLTRWMAEQKIWAKLILWAIIIYICIDLFSFGSSVLPQVTQPVQVFFLRFNGPMQLDKPAELFHVDTASVTGAGRSVASVHQPFTQIRVPDLEKHRHGAHSNQYLPLLQNKGVVDAYETLPFRRYVNAAGDTGYKGEYYLLQEGKSELLTWSPNKLKFHVRSNSPNRLVINQNYWRGWHSSSGVISNHEGLLAVDLHAGEYDVSISYLPGFFLWGLCLFFATAIGILVFIIKGTSSGMDQSNA